MVWLTMQLFSALLVVARAIDNVVCWLAVMPPRALTTLNRWKFGYYEIHIPGEPVRVMFVNNVNDAALFEETVRQLRERVGRRLTIKGS